MSFAREFTLITCLFKLASIEHAWLRHCYYFRWQSFLYSAPIVDLSEEFLTAITSLMEPPRRDAGRLLPKSLIQDCSSGSWALRRRRRNFSQILVTFFALSRRVTQKLPAFSSIFRLPIYECSSIRFTIFNRDSHFRPILSSKMILLKWRIDTHYRIDNNLMCDYEVYVIIFLSFVGGKYDNPTIRCMITKYVSRRIS